MQHVMHDLITGAVRHEVNTQGGFTAGVYLGVYRAGALLFAGWEYRRLYSFEKQRVHTGRGFATLRPRTAPAGRGGRSAATTPRRRAAAGFVLVDVPNRDAPAGKRRRHLPWRRGAAA